MSDHKNQAPKPNNGDVKKRERELDEASKESFPASDAPAWVSHDQQPKKPQKPH